MLRSDWRRIKQHFNKEERFQFVSEFIALGLAEMNEIPVFVICVMENGAEYMRDILGEFFMFFQLIVSFSAYLADAYATLPVKVGSLQNKQIVETMPISTYFKRVMESCHHGTFRYGPMHSLSFVGTKQEECGDYFKEIIAELNKSPLLRLLMPWGPLSIQDGSDPKDSDDGPIYWYVNFGKNIFIYLFLGFVLVSNSFLLMNSKTSIKSNIETDLLEGK